MKLGDVDTPALVLEIDKVERNVERMARFFESAPSGLRPHFKTPKCVDVARMQLEAGAIGITCAKLGEAEVIADAALEASVLIANQIVGSRKLERLVELASRLPELLVAVDAPEQVEALDSALAGTARRSPGPGRLGAIVEVDVGMKRCGTSTPDETVELARALERSRVDYRGIMGYEGHAVLVPDASDRKQRAEAAMQVLTSHREALEAAGLRPEIVSAGGTGTHEISGTTPGVTEIQAGSYVFMDGAYRRVRDDFECALTVHTTILRRRGRMLITDCGMKALSHEFGMPRGADLPLGCVALSEEHGHVLIDENEELALAAGDRIRILPSHGDTTINLHDTYHVARGDEIEALWPIAARGRFR